MGLTIGYKASAEQFAPAQLARFAVLAERVGLDSVAVSDHFQPWRLTGGHAIGALPWIGYVAARTERVLLGTSVLSPSWRYNPAVVAQAMATLGLLAPGRVFLGVGSGEALNEAAVGALPAGQWPPFKERFARLREAVQVIRGLWTQDVVTFEGDYFQVHDARLFDRPEQPIPLYIAAGGPMMARYAGRAADGLLCTSGKGRSLYADDLLPAVTEGRAKAGRADDPVARVIEIKLSYDPDPARALANTRFWAPLSLTADDKHSLTSPEEFEAAADALPIEQVARRWIVTPDPQHVVDAVKVYTDLGFDHLLLHGPGEDQERFLEVLARDVLPGLRELAGPHDEHQPAGGHEAVPPAGSAPGSAGRGSTRHTLSP